MPYSISRSVIPNLVVTMVVSFLCIIIVCFYIVVRHNHIYNCSLMVLPNIATLIMSDFMSCYVRCYVCRPPWFYLQLLSRGLTQYRHTKLYHPILLLSSLTSSPVHTLLLSCYPSSLLQIAHNPPMMGAGVVLCSLLINVCEEQLGYSKLLILLHDAIPVNVSCAVGANAFAPYLAPDHPTLLQGACSYFGPKCRSEEVFWPLCIELAKSCIDCSLFIITTEYRYRVQTAWGINSDAPATRFKSKIRPILRMANVPWKIQSK